MPTREQLIAKASWWSGWCTDHDTELPDLAKLGGFLLEMKYQMMLDRMPVIEADQDHTVTHDAEPITFADITANDHGYEFNTPGGNA